MTEQVTGTDRASGDARSRLLECALTLFSQMGYRDTSMREVAEMAGVTKPALYYHFGSKEGLLREIMGEPMVRFRHSLSELLTRPSGACFRERLADIIWVHFDLCSQHPRQSHLLYMLMFSPTRDLPTETWAPFRDANHADMIRMIRDAAEAGEIVSDDPDMIYTMVIGAINLYIMRRFPPYGDRADMRFDRALAEALAARLCEGLYP